MELFTLIISILSILPLMAWNDDVSTARTPTNLTLQCADSLPAWADAHQLLLAQQLALTGGAGDALLGWDDDISTDLQGVAADIPLEVGDSLPAWGDFTPLVRLEYRVVANDDANNWNDAVAVSATSALVLSDSFTLSDAVETDLQDVGATDLPLDVNDFIALVDAAELRLDQFLSVSDSFVLTDTIITIPNGDVRQINVSDSFTLSDFTPTLGGDYLLELADSQAQSDAVATQTVSNELTLDLSDFITQVDVIEVSAAGILVLTDDANNWQDSVQTSAPQGPEITLGLADSLPGFTDAVSHRTNLLLVAADSTSQSDAFTAGSASILDLTDFTVQADSVEYAATGFLAIADDAKFWLDDVDTSAPQGPDLTLGLTDSTSQDDAVAVESAGSLGLTDFITQVDVVELSPADLLTLADSFSLSDGVETTEAKLLALSDSLPAFGDATTQTLGLRLSVADSTSQSDAVTIASGIRLDVNDVIALVDIVELSSDGFLALADDAKFWLDSVSTSAPQGPFLQLGLADSFTLTDAVSRRAGSAIALADSTGQTDALRTVIGLRVAVADDAANLADAAAVSSVGTVLLSDSQTQTDGLALGYGLLATDTGNLADAVDYSLSEVGKLPIVDSLPVQTDAVRLALEADLTSVKRIYVVPADPRLSTVAVQDRIDIPIPE